MTAPAQDLLYAIRMLRKLPAVRLSMIFLGVFAGTAVLLACVGIYGVVSYLAGQRTREIGVRMALGAQRGDVLRLILTEGGKMALIGVAAGIGAAFGLTKLMANQLFGVSAHDPLTFAAVGAILILVALLACYFPPTAPRASIPQPRSGASSLGHSCRQHHSEVS
jgi:ABC-type antimicrobial peptide transport system permease subunit